MKALVENAAPHKTTVRCSSIGLNLTCALSSFILGLTRDLNPAQSPMLVSVGTHCHPQTKDDDPASPVLDDDGPSGAPQGDG